uniref:MULE transposase domain-containing protein n=1 Tax=Schizaphis graminum TaxID=13262 RepID=A0A2S2PH43_SCHGA
MEQQCRIRPQIFFQQHLPFMVEGEQVGVIFSNLDAIQKYREELLTVTFAGIDGTFKTVPKSPPQLTKGCLLTFQVVLKNVSFPMVYALTSRMTQATYESFLRIVREVLPLNYAQLTIISDYERGLINAVESTFPFIPIES